MKSSKNSLLILFLLTINLIQAQDLANIKYYHKQNLKLNQINSGENRIVFMGNSITEQWKKLDPDFFKNKNYINRGISGETTSQILNRFKSDVINLHPKLVIILAGVNDIAQNTGPITLKEISENIFTMAELAKDHKIKVVLCSILPALDFPWKRGLNPAEKIIILNELIKNYADKNGIIYLDYFTAMVDQKMGLNKQFTYDGVHPNKTGYQIMNPLVEKAIAKAIE